MSTINPTTGKSLPNPKTSSKGVKDLAVNEEFQKLKELIGGSDERTRFFLEWVHNGRNARKAYQELHPSIHNSVADVLGSRMLSKIPREVVLQAHNITPSRVFGKIEAGLDAKKQIDDGEGLIEVDDHNTQIQYTKMAGEILGILNTKQPAVIIKQAVNKQDLEDIVDGEII